MFDEAALADAGCTIDDRDPTGTAAAGIEFGSECREFGGTTDEEIWAPRGRSEGSWRSAASMAPTSASGRSGFTSRGGTKRASAMRNMVWIGVAPGKGSVPVASS